MLAVAPATLTAAAAAGALLLSPSAALGAENDARLRSALNDAMRQASAQSGAYVYDLGDRRPLYSRRATKGRILASNTKLFTTSAALDHFGPHGTFLTEVLADRSPTREGVVRGSLYLRGGGDPSFGSASFAQRAYGGGGATLEALARRVKRAGVRRVTGAVVGDETLFDSLRGGPDSGYGVSVWVGPLSALSYNRGLASENGSAFQRTPPQFAAARLAAELKRLGVRIGRKAGVSAAGDRVKPLAAVESIPVSRLLRLTNKISDNFFAEMLAKQLDAEAGHRATTAGGSAAAAEFARQYGATARLVDGSGLARGNISSPRGVARLLRGMLRHTDYRAFYDSLAVPGEYGTLETRRTSRRCRGKTGTITGVSNLSGYCRARSGDLIVFSFLMNRVYSYDSARRLQDRMTWALARYG